VSSHPLFNEGTSPPTKEPSTRLHKLGARGERALHTKFHFSGIHEVYIHSCVSNPVPQKCTNLRVEEYLEEEVGPGGENWHECEGERNKADGEEGQVVHQDYVIEYDLGEEHVHEVSGKKCDGIEC